MTDAADAATAGEALSPAERAYFDTKGAAVAGLGEAVPDAAAAPLNPAYLADAQAFVERNPDFIAGYRHLQHSRDQELALAGHDDPAIRLEIIKAEERDIVIRALHGGASPAERIYALAKARGYRGEAGRSAERIETIQRGQAAAKSLSSVGGTSGEALTAEA